MCHRRKRGKTEINSFLDKVLNLYLRQVNEENKLVFVYCKNADEINLCLTEKNNEKQKVPVIEFLKDFCFYQIYKTLNFNLSTWIGKKLKDLEVIL